MRRDSSRAWRTSPRRRNPTRLWVACCERHPKAFPKRVRQALLKDPEGLPAHLERVLVALEAVRQQIVEADTELRMLAEADQRMTR